MLFSSPRYVFFLLVLTIQGVAAASLGLYLLMFVRDLGGSYTLAGLTVVFQTLGEIPFFWYSKDMLRKWGEPVMLGVSLLAYVVRVAVISVLVNPWWAHNFVILLTSSLDYYINIFDILHIYICVPV